MKIISGGQSGSDLAGNRFAKRYNIETEINTFKGFKPVFDELPDDIKINYVLGKGDYKTNLVKRTIYNVKLADFTVILLDKPLGATRGSKLTFDYCKYYKKPCYYANIYTEEGTVYCPESDRQFFCFQVDLAKRYMNFTEDSILNVAGSRDLDRADCIKFLEKLLDSYINKDRI